MPTYIWSDTAAGRLWTDVHAHIIEAHSTVDVKPAVGGVPELVGVGGRGAFIYPESVSGEEGKVRARLTVAIQLACTVDGQQILAFIGLIRAELAGRTLVGEMRALFVAKGKFVPAAALEDAGFVCSAIGDRVAVGEELEGASLEAVIFLVAGLAFVGAASVNERIRGEEKEWQR